MKNNDRIKRLPACYLLLPAEGLPIRSPRVLVGSPEQQRMQKDCINLDAKRSSTCYCPLTEPSGQTVCRLLHRTPEEEKGDYEKAH